MTVATVGYGDVPPQNVYERLYLVFAMFIVRPPLLGYCI